MLSQKSDQNDEPARLCPKRKHDDYDKETVEIDGRILSVFTCPVCLGVFDQPKMLPGCGHCLCLNCAREFLKDKANKNLLSCPECRHSNALGPSGVNGLKTVFAVQRAIELLGKDKLALKSSTLGERCPHFDLITSSSSPCSHCNQNFCNACLVSHVERLKLEMSWLTSDFAGRFEMATKQLDENIDYLTGSLCESVDSVEQKVIAASNELCEKLTSAVAKQKDRLLRTVHQFYEAQSKKLASVAGHRNLATEITAVSDNVNQLSIKSPLLCSLDQVCDVYQESSRIDKIIEQLEGVNRGILFDEISFKFAFDDTSNNQFANILSEAARIEVKPMLRGSELWGNIPSEIRKFHCAVASGDLPTVKSIIDRKTLSPDCKAFVSGHKDETHCRKLTPLMYAAKLGALPLVKYFAIEQGVNLFSKSAELEDSSAGMAVHFAAENGHLEVVKFFLDFAPQLSSAYCSNGASLLHCAAVGGHVDLMKFLIDNAGASIEHRNNDGLTVLLQAARESKLEAVKFLVTVGANIRAKCNQNNSVLHHAVQGGDADTFKYLFEHVPDYIEERNHETSTPLHYAVIESNLAIADFILRQIGYCPVEGEMPILPAVVKGDLPMVQLLMKYGATIDHWDRFGQTVLHIAAFHGHTNLSTFFADSHPDLLKRRDCEGQTPVGAAISGGHLELAYLLDQKAKCKK